MLLSRLCACRSDIIRKMSSISEDSLLQAAKMLVPSLSSPKHKGQDGRIGIVGGSLEYSGAPYFAGMSALRTGADLVHIFCCREASTPIKTFSPELIVHPVLDDSNALNLIKPWLERLHVILIGPGLGREEKVFETVSNLISLCRGLSKPLVIDADGLFLVGQKPELIKNYPGIILTPNAMEFTRLVKAVLNRNVELASVVDESILKELASAIGDGATVVHKGSRDGIAQGRKDSPTGWCSAAGSGRRCGGQGDLLSGAIAVFTGWAHARGDDPAAATTTTTAGCYAACRLVRECNAAAFRANRRGMLATDMLKEVAPTFARLFEGASD